MFIKISDKKKMVHETTRALRRFIRHSKNNVIDTDALALIIANMMQLLLDHDGRIGVNEANILRLRDRCGF